MYPVGIAAKHHPALAIFTPQVAAHGDISNYQTMDYHPSKSSDGSTTSNPASRKAWAREL